jgi:hypothetical protein
MRVYVCANDTFDDVLMQVHQNIRADANASKYWCWCKYTSTNDLRMYVIRMLVACVHRLVLKCAAPLKASIHCTLQALIHCNFNEST